MNAAPHQAWPTRDEIAWLNKIGNTHADCQLIPKKKMLEGYLVGLNRRYYMAAIVREEAAAHAKVLLQQLTRKQA